jgi:hypothetical protein
MNPDELIWRIAEEEELLRDCEKAGGYDPAVELIKARIVALKHELKATIDRPALGQQPVSQQAQRILDQGQ